MSDASRLADLIASDALEEAAALAEELGRFAEAADLWERACRYPEAAAAALAARDARRSFELSARAGDEAAEQRALAELLGDVPLGRSTAEAVRARGQFLPAARLWQALGDTRRAAEDFEAGGALLLAGKAFDQSGDPKSAARCFDTLLAATPQHAGARLALGDLLSRHGRHQAAVKALQPIPPEAEERLAALRILHRCYDALSLREAARSVAQELEALGAKDPPPEAATPTATTPSEPEQVVFGRYRVVREVARTATARVLEAIDRISQTRVAVKIFSASSLRDSGRDALRRFEREAVALSQLRHPAILPLHAFLPEGPAVVLPWMGGGSLADVIAQGPLSPARAVEITLAVLAALDQAHRRGILHRDVKPGNVLFDEAGAAYLADFGTAHISDSAVTVTAGILGTLAYMAPEQRAGAPATLQSDVYGAGALLWHALTGAPPDAGLTPLSRELTPAHEDVARALIAAEPERPADAQAARELLRSLDWPREVPDPRPDVALPPPRLPEADLRLEPLGGQLFRDVLLGRTVLVSSAAAGVLERALCFSRADDPSLAAILAHRADAGTLWIEDIPVPLLGPISEGEYGELERALSALHRAGGVHGAVDSAHVTRQGGRMMLRFPQTPRHHDAARDLEDLRALATSLWRPEA